MHAERLSEIIRQLAVGGLPVAVRDAVERLQRDPNDIPSLTLLSGLARAQGEWRLSIELVTRRIELGEIDAATWNELGELFRRIGDLGRAEDLFRKAIAEAPHIAELYHNLGNVCRLQGNNLAAVDAYRIALRIKPELVETLNNLALLQSDQACEQEALALLRSAISVRFNDCHTLLNLARVLLKQGFDRPEQVQEARNCLNKLLDFEPQNEDAMFLLSRIERHEGKTGDAAAWLRKAVATNPRSYRAHQELGNFYADSHYLPNAISEYETAVSLAPNLGALWFDLGNLYFTTNDLKNSIVSLRRAVECSPGIYESSLANTLQHACDWTELDVVCQTLVEQLESSMETSNPPNFSPFAIVTLAHPTTPRQQLSVAQLHAKRCEARVRRNTSRDKQSKSHSDKARNRSANPRIRIGYLSSDFHDHATARLIKDLFIEHDRNDFEIFGYSFGPDDSSPMRTAVIQSFDGFRELRTITNERAAQWIREDEIDILVDLKGYTAGCRSEILALRPCAIQVNFLGYPGTMGADFIDFAIVDEFVVPLDQQPFYSEKLVYVPGCYQPNLRLDAYQLTTSNRASVGLPSQGTVLCAFHNAYKITNAIFDVWIDGLRTHEDSVLWLLATHPLAEANLRREAAARGLPPNRLIFAPVASYEEHLSRLSCADLFLDTYPVNAHTTASEFLRMGVPMITLAGDTFVSRVAGSLLHSLGLSELISTNMTEYRYKLMSLLNSAERLDSTKHRLRNAVRSSDLFDPTAYARKLESSFREIIERKRRDS